MTEQDINESLSHPYHSMGTIADLLQFWTGYDIDEVLATLGIYEQFLVWPAATPPLHHSYEGGLLRHTREVMELINFWWSCGRQLDYTVAMTAAFFHDLGKIYEYMEDGQRSPQEKVGSHVMHSMKMYWAWCRHKEIEPSEHVLHCIAAHHGKVSTGALEDANTLEAHLVNKADEFSAAMDAYETFYKEPRYETISVEDTWVYKLKDIK